MADDQVRTMNTQLDKAVAGGDPAKVLHVSERLLAVAPNDIYALRCKASALIQQGKHVVAIKSLEHIVELSKASATMTADDAYMYAETVFDLALCYYKTSRYADALTSLDELQSKAASVKGDLQQASQSPSLIHLRAQIYYNMERYRDAIPLYQSMLDAGQYRDEVEKSELMLNLTACYACAEDAAACNKVIQAHNNEITYDTLYNLGTAYVTTKQSDLALQTLEKAEDWCCREHNVQKGGVFGSLSKKSEGAAAGTDDEQFTQYKNDVCAIKVQQAYALFLKGDEAAASTILDSVLTFKPTSSTTYAVACVNSAAIKRQSDFVETYRRLQAAQLPAVSAKLTSAQRLFVQYNSCLLLLSTGGKSKHHQCKLLAEKMCQEILQGGIKSDLGPLAMAAVLAQNKNANAAEDYLSSFLQKSSTAAGGTASSSGAHLMLAQLYVNRKEVGKALDLIRKHDALLRIPAVMSTALAAFSSLSTDDSRAGISEILAAAKAHFGEEEKCWRFIAAFALRNRMHKEASDALTKLLSFTTSMARNPALAGNVQAALAVSLAALNKPADAEKILVASIPASGPLDVAALVSDLPKRSQLDAAGYKRAIAGDAKLLLKHKRNRAMRRPPKKMVEGARVDPERWLPMKIRSYVKELPVRRQKELKVRRSDEDKERRKARRKALEAAAAATAAAAAPPATA